MHDSRHEVQAKVSIKVPEKTPSECATSYSITTNQAAIIALFRVTNRYVGNLAPMPGVFPIIPPRWCATPTPAAS